LSLVISKSSLETKLFSLFSSFMFKNIVIMFEIFVKNIVNSSESRRDENFLAKLIHNAISSFVLSFYSFFFVSFFFALLSFVSFVFLSFFDTSRFRKRARESFLSMSRKRVNSTKNECECIMSRKWLERLTQTNRIENVKQTKHLLSVLYYLKKLICKNHINQMRHLYDLLSIEDFEEMKNALWDFLKFERSIKIFEIQCFYLFEISKNDD
jgi:ABC-type multidrug transport system fused ATPase/permease subunit